MDVGRAERRARVDVQACHEGLRSDASVVGRAKHRLSSAQMARDDAEKLYHRKQEDAADAEQVVAVAKLDEAEARSKARPRRAALQKAVQEAEARLGDARDAMTAAKSAAEAGQEFAGT